MILYTVFGLLVFVGLAVCILLVILSILCFRKIKKRRGTLEPPNSPNTGTYFNEEAKSESLFINAAVCQVVNPELAFLK